ncbi:extracellular serine proteinase-like [Saccoglossus kowalevskii]
MLRLVLLCAVVIVAASQAAPLYRTSKLNRVPNKYIVILKDDNVEEVSNRISKLNKSLFYSAKVLKKWNTVIFGMSVEMTERTLNRVRTFPEVEYVEEDSLARGNVASWGLDRVDQRFLPLDDVFIPRGDGAGVNSYVFDTGIRLSHVDFEGRAEFFYDAVQDGQQVCISAIKNCFW